jgi:hypothetical protein
MREGEACDNEIGLHGVLHAPLSRTDLDHAVVAEVVLSLCAGRESLPAWGDRKGES